MCEKYLSQEVYIQKDNKSLIILSQNFTIHKLRAVYEALRSGKDFSLL